RETPVKIVNIETAYAIPKSPSGTPCLLVFPIKPGNHPSFVASIIGYFIDAMVLLRLVARAKIAPPIIKNRYKGSGRNAFAVIPNDCPATSSTGSTPPATIQIKKYTTEIVTTEIIIARGTFFLGFFV